MARLMMLWPSPERSLDPGLLAQWDQWIARRGGTPEPRDVGDFLAATRPAGDSAPHAFAFRSLIVGLAQSGRPDEAKAVAEALLAAFPKRTGEEVRGVVASALFHAAVISASAGDVEFAMRLLNALIARCIDAEDVMSRRLLAAGLYHWGTYRLRASAPSSPGAAQEALLAHSQVATTTATCARTSPTRARARTSSRMPARWRRIGTASARGCRCDYRHRGRA
jgi:hypothetical protein